MPSFGPVHHKPAMHCFVTVTLSVALAATLGCASNSGSDAGGQQAPPSQPVPAAEGPATPSDADAAPSDADALKGDSAPSPAANAEPPVAQPPEPRELPEGYLAFKDACAPEGDIVTIAAVGDIMGHRELQRQAYRSPERFRNIWANVEDLLGSADITYANLEAPTAQGIGRDGELSKDPGVKFDNHVYSGYAKFNINAVIIEDLLAAGIDIVSTANNHSLDRGSLGVDRTLDALDKAKLPHTGTRRKGTKEDWHTTTQSGGLTIAWLACTLHTNFGKDDFDQVLHCFDKKDSVRKLVRRLAKKEGIDAVIVTPHWGKEYSHQPRKRQKEFAQRWVDAGATAIIGSHPHVIEPWDTLEASDGRAALVMYSLGNFFSHQRTLNRRSTVVLYFGLRKRDDHVEVVGARYVPLHVRMKGEKEAFFVEAIDRVKGPADARALLVEQMGPYNLMHPDEPLDVVPHCDATWAFPDERGVPGWTPTPAQK